MCAGVGCDTATNNPPPDTQQLSDTGETCDPADKPETTCNTCQCTDGAWACTSRACLDGGPTDTGDAGTACEDGEQKQKGCNLCTCTDGRWACTRRACPDTGTADTGSTDASDAAGDTGAACEDGDQKQQGCNTCTCIDGHWACTKRACLDTGTADTSGN